MNAFLREAKRLVGLKESLCLVLGNESCDLDSAVSSICLAFYYKYNATDIPRESKSKDNVVPVFNVLRKNLPLKTEVSYYLKSHNIELDNLICHDDIPSEVFENSSIILVDHHCSPYAKNVIAVVDHRPYDPSCDLPSSCRKIIHDVGSCATLVANFILESDIFKGDNTLFIEPLKLLYGPIVLDTVNFSKAADKVREMDIQTAAAIDPLIGIKVPDSHRKSVFDGLVTARNDINNLTPIQMLYKDLKIIRGNGVSVAIPGFPILVKQYIKQPNVVQAVEQFAKENECSIICLMGMKVTDGDVRRDFGLVCIETESKSMFDSIVKHIESHTELSLEKYNSNEFPKGLFFTVHNIKASRKQILPIIKQVIV